MSSFRRALRVITALYWVTIFVLTHIPRVPQVPGPQLSDKLIHAVAYFILALLLMCWLGPKWAWRVLAIGLIYGAIDELLQIPVGRGCELADWVADGIGTACAVLSHVLVARLLDRRRAQAIVVSHNGR